MVVTTLLPQQLHTTLADLSLPTRLHSVTPGSTDDGDTSGFHWVWLLVLLLKLLPFVLAIAGIIYRKTRRGATNASSAYAPNGPIVAPWQPMPTQPSGGYVTQSQPVAPWQPAPAYSAAPALAPSAPLSYAPAPYR